MKGGRRLLTVPLAPVSTTTLSQSSGGRSSANFAVKTVTAVEENMSHPVQALKTDNNLKGNAKGQPSQTSSVVCKRRRLLVAPSIRSNSSTPSQLTAGKPSQLYACGSSSCKEATAAPSSLQQSPRVACKSSHAGQDADCRVSLAQAAAMSGSRTQLTSHDSSIISDSPSMLLHAPSCALALFGGEIPQARPDSPAKISAQQQQFSHMSPTADAASIKYLTPLRADSAMANLNANAPAEALSQLYHASQNLRQIASMPQQAPQSSQSHNKKSDPMRQDNSAGKPAAMSCDSPDHVSKAADVPNGKQKGLGHLMLVQRLPAVLTASLPSAEDLGINVNLPTAGAMIGQLTIQFAPTSAMAYAASNLVAKTAMSNLKSHLKPKTKIAAMHTIVKSDIIKVKEILNVANAGALQLVTEQLEPLLDQVQELKLAAPTNIIEHHMTSANQSAPPREKEHAQHTPHKKQLSEARPGSDIATEAEESCCDGAAVQNMVAEQQHEFAELLQSPEKQAEEFGNRQDEFAVSVHYLQAILGC